MSPRLPHPNDGQITAPVPPPPEVGAADDGLRFVRDSWDALEAPGDETILDHFARLAVPRLADWCAVDVVDGAPVLRRVAVAHAEPTVASLLRELGNRNPARLDSPFGAGKVARTGERELIPQIDEATLGAIAEDTEQLTLWRTLGLRATLILPLRWGDVVLGTVLLAHTGVGRRFDEPTVALAEALARHAALAVSHARAERAAREAESALEATRRELRTTSERLAEMASELAIKSRLADESRSEAEEAGRAKGQFLARMSHELRTPLNAIGGYTQLLEMGVRGSITDAQREDLHRIQRSQLHLLSLVNDVLNFAKLEAGHVAYEIAPIPVARLVTDLRPLVMPQIEAKGQRLELNGVHRDYEALGDAEKIEQILLNLLSNAVKFTAEGGRLRISLEGGRDDVRIAVQDSGIGLPPEKLEAAFEPFVQLSHPLSGAPRGTGLGLAISRDLARGMGGDLLAESEPGVGSTFTLVLRRSAPDPGRGSARRSRSPQLRDP